MAFLDSDQISRMGFLSTGKNIRISSKASIHGAERIVLGDHVRIDDFCVISAGEGGIELGSYIHIAVFSSLIGKGRITLSDFCNISARVSLYSSNDDYSGKKMTNPTVAHGFRNVNDSPVYLGRHVIIGCGSVVLPGVRLEEGVAVGALSLVNSDCDAFGIYAGIPVKRIGDRSKNLLDLESEFLSLG